MNDKNIKPLSRSPLQNSLIRFYYLALCFCFLCLKHWNISGFIFVSDFVFSISWLHSPRIGRTFPGPLLEAVGLNQTKPLEALSFINDQWRICFVWDDNDAYNVEIADYH